MDDPKMGTILLCIFLLSCLYQIHRLKGDPRTHTLEVICDTQLEHNVSVYVPNFLQTMDNINAQLRTSHYGFSQVGLPPDASFGLAQCYGDLSTLDCALCYAQARTILPRCYPVTGGRIFLDGCFMRAENASFFQEFSSSLDKAICGNTTRGSSQFANTARQSISQAVSLAPTSGGYARAAVVGNESVYVLANCWGSLNASSCQACLESASVSVVRCLPWSEGRALHTGCFLRYSSVDFLNPIPSSGPRVSTVVLIVAVVSSVAILLLLAAVGLYFWKQRKLQKKREESDDASKMASILFNSSLNFKYSALEKATRGFSNVNKLGQGGFGTVYKGVLADGREVAVKRLFFNNKHRAADFYNEVNIISSVEHRNLVRLLGCSCSGPESLLVYEFLPNKSLDCFIFDDDKGKKLNWEKRFNIIIGAVEGLVYLHENAKTRIIHRDIKASNILLDSRLRSKIADFGLARSFQEDKSHISTAIAGTLGYMAPEYLAYGQLTEKVDVYSFGVLLMEIATGMQNNRSKHSEQSESLVTKVWRNFQVDAVEELIDPNLMVGRHEDKEVIKGEVLRVVHIALLCAQENPSLRPPMSRVLQMLLKRENHELPLPSSPPFTDEKTMELNDSMSHSTRSVFNTSSSHSAASLTHSSFYPR